MGPDYLRASNGDGPAVRATISSDRLPTDMDIITDSVANWPAKGIATSGTPDDDGIIIPETECVFYYVLSGTIIHITGFAPGYSDVGNTEGQIVILKPTTAWTDAAAEILEEGGGGTSIIVQPEPPADEDAVWYDTDEETDGTVTSLLSLMMPVGYIVINRTNAANPATYYGFGTWVQIEDKMIMAKGSTYTADGGSATHTHDLSDNGYAKVGTSNPGPSIRAVSVPAWTATHDYGASRSDSSASRTGGAALDGTTDAGSTIPPMIVAYVWERTA